MDVVHLEESVITRAIGIHVANGTGLSIGLAHGKCPSNVQGFTTEALPTQNCLELLRIQFGGRPLVLL